jgi:hypothetical protein
MPKHACFCFCFSQVLTAVGENHDGCQAPPKISLQYYAPLAAYIFVDPIFWDIAEVCTL